MIERPDVGVAGRPDVGVARRPLLAARFVPHNDRFALASKRRIDPRLAQLQNRSETRRPGHLNCAIQFLSTTSRNCSTTSNHRARRRRLTAPGANMRAAPRGLTRERVRQMLSGTLRGGREMGRSAGGGKAYAVARWRARLVSRPRSRTIRRIAGPRRRAGNRAWAAG